MRDVCLSYIIKHKDFTMQHRMCILSLVLSLLGILVPCTKTVAQHKLDLFVAPELLYSDVVYDKVYEAVFNLNPGFKWHMPHHWMLTGQVTVPIYNDYGPYYNRVRPTMAVLSKESRISRDSYLKCSTGLFNLERYGFDVQWIHHINSWLSLEAQANYTGFCSFSEDFTHERIDRFAYVAGIQGYYAPKDIQARVQAGRFLNEEYCMKVEAFRHTKYVSIGGFAEFSEDDRTGGFVIVVKLPPYKSTKHKKFVVRPASNFRLTNNMDAGTALGKMVFTDPEYNERDGAFQMTKGGMR